MEDIKIIKYLDGVMYKGKNRRILVWKENERIFIQFNLLIDKSDAHKYIEKPSIGRYILRDRILVSTISLSDDSALGLMAAIHELFNPNSTE